MIDHPDPDPIAMSLLWNREPIRWISGYAEDWRTRDKQPVGILHPGCLPLPTVAARPSELRSADRLNPGKPRKYPEPIVGAVVGPWTITKIIGRGWRGRSDLRIAAQCTCGRVVEMYEAYMRLGAGCRHGGMGG